MLHSTTSSLPPGRSGVFLSYARADGEKFATDLRLRLEAEHILVWQDRIGMEGGQNWWRQITEALDRVEFLVLRTGLETCQPAALDAGHALLRPGPRLAEVPQ